MVLLRKFFSGCFHRGAPAGGRSGTWDGAHLAVQDGGFNLVPLRLMHSIWGWIFSAERRNIRKCLPEYAAIARRLEAARAAFARPVFFSDRL